MKKYLFSTLYALLFSFRFLLFPLFSLFFALFLLFILSSHHAYCIPVEEPQTESRMLQGGVQRCTQPVGEHQTHICASFLRLAFFLLSSLYCFFRLLTDVTYRESYSMTSKRNVEMGVMKFDMKSTIWNITTNQN